MIKMVQCCWTSSATSRHVSRFPSYSANSCHNASDVGLTCRLPKDTGQRIPRANQHLPLGFGLSGPSSCLPPRRRWHSGQLLTWHRYREVSTQQRCCLKKCSALRQLAPGFYLSVFVRHTNYIQFTISAVVQASLLHCSYLSSSARMYSRMSGAAIPDVRVLCTSAKGLLLQWR